MSGERLVSNLDPANRVVSCVRECTWLLAMSAGNPRHAGVALAASGANSVATNNTARDPIMY